MWAAAHLVLLDWLENKRTANPGFDLNAWEKKVGVRVESGDVVFIRTGRCARRRRRPVECPLSIRQGRTQRVRVASRT
ncbi:MAG: cyclase family protein [Bryobacteraceae bacterium]